ncbi:MAG: imidazolonepropionase [Candidatus Eisenbacteria bacterium]|nr:imidazolonepropionase [Candidatus Eisenbacteria bacterium]
MRADLLVRNVGRLLTMSDGAVPRIGEEMRATGEIAGGALAASGGEIVAVGPERDVVDSVELAPGGMELDAGGSLVTPGLVDPHTHAVFARTRENEFAMRVAGRSYEEIAEAGGGIRSSVRAVREISEDGLVESGRRTLDAMLAYGTTTAEVKSGYGLSTQSELKMLRAIRRLGGEHDVRLVPTFLGAHEFPDEWREDREGYVSLIVDEMIPAVASESLAAYCDVFCEEGVFTVEQSRRILTAGRSAGLEPKLHADELHPYGAAELAAELGARSADHLVRVSDEGVAALARAGVAAVLLPGTSLSLGGTSYAPARKLVEAGVPVALATDCNPGSSMTESMQIVMALASMAMRMTPEEVLCASTVNAAWACGVEGVSGTLEPGRSCDLVIWDVQDPRAIPYHYGVNLVRQVVVGGRPVLGGS